MATKFAVSTVFKGVDKMSNVFKKMSRNGSKAFNRIGGAMEKFNRQTSKLQKFAGGAAAFVGLTGGVMAFKNAITSTIEKGVEFEKTLVAATTKFGDVAKRGTENFRNLRKTVMQVGATTEFTATEAAKGLDFLAMAGFNVQQSIAALPGVVDLATAANVDLAGATDMASDSLGAFNLMSKDSAQLAKNLARVNDVLAKTTTTANVDMAGLFETIKDAAPVATSAGASIEEFAALTGIMANAGVKGTKAGTTLKNMFINLQSPTKSQADLLRKLKIQIKDANGEMLPMSNILGQLNKKTSKMESVQKNATIATLFGKRAIAGATVLLNAGEKTIEKYTQQLQKATGATAEMAKEMRDTTEGRIKVMQSAIEGLQLQLFDALQPALESIVNVLTKAATAMANFSQKNPIVIKIIGVLSAALIVAAGAILAVTAATWLWNAALAANPIVWIIAGVMALIAAIGLLIYYWDDVTKFIVDKAKVVGKWLVTAWEPVGAFFAELWDGIKINFFEAMDFILAGIHKFINVMKNIPGLGDKMQPLEAKIQGYRESVGSELISNEKPQLVSPQLATAQYMMENASSARAEVLIKDQTGRATMLREQSNGGALISMESTAGAVG